MYNIQNMNWYNVRELEKRLLDGQVDDIEELHYLVMNVLIFSIAPYLYVISPEQYYENAVMFVIELIAVVVITLVGIKMTFEINKLNGGQDYLKRFLALYFVNSIRILVFIFAATIPMGLILYLFNESYADQAPMTDTMHFALGLTVMLIFYWMLIRSFNRISKIKQNQ